MVTKIAQVGLTALLFFVLLGGISLAQAVTPQNLAGDWSGAITAGGNSLPMVLHLKAEADGKLSATFDSPSQGAYGIPVAAVELSGSNFHMEAAAVHGTYSGTVSADGKTITGTWSQGKPLPLVLKQSATAAELAQIKPSPIDGDWSGTLRAGGASLRLLFHFHAAPQGKIDGTLDSLDQGAMGIACANVKLKGQKLSLSVPPVHGLYEATLSVDGNKLSGTWDQGAPLPLDLKREVKQATILTAPAPAAPPVALKDLQQVLDKEMGPIIAAWKNAGIVLGIVDHGERKVFAYGTAKPDSMFEIGSVTKTFTGLALAQMAEQHVVTLNEPVRELLPPGTVAKPSSGPEITLLDLATQHSGLPRLPDNMHPKRPSDPYGDYSAKDLYTYLAQHGVGRPEKTDFAYSNLGFGLLGQALADKADESYENLIRQQIIEPLALKDTVVNPTAAQEARIIQGYSGSHDKAAAWTFESLAGAGALISTADDLLTYTQAYLHPEKFPAAGSGPASTLAAALTLAQQPQADGPANLKIALGWLLRPEANIYWHDGGTGGYSSLVLFVPKLDRAIVVLYNCLDLNPGKLQLADRIAANVMALMDGTPVTPLTL